MKYLIIYAHPNPKSFNNAIKDAVISKLTKEDKSFEIRDLYALGFDPILKGSDFIGFKEGKIPLDIVEEQNYIKSADRIILIHPIWWFGMPAILKGYIDRVFSYGFAYRAGEKGIEGLLTGKKVFILNTTGETQDQYVQYGFKDAISKTFQNGIFNFCGMEIISHQFFFAVPTITDADRKNILKQISTMPF
ncbi:MAG TPA: NAD(P)H-dependent oxidoreductase [Candidatus Omnitrophota bacterium]|nr:NAD(P)H-dependent oxidoreductase [Candidatus Omnitrophota bacterium]HPN88363.1 NAD(P)H-dependent oxidoreductase [Candidatus Omnitrophota bacterium]